MYSSVADRVEACVLDDTGAEQRTTLERGSDAVWRGRMQGAGIGSRYGFRVEGDAPRARFCDPARLLLDPYARGVDERDGGPDGSALVGVVLDESFDWGDDSPPRTDWADTVLYEAHVRGATVRHPAVPPALRGSYLGLAHDAVLEHLVGLGITAVELLPVFHWLDEPFLVSRGLTDYWGYNPIALFAPTCRYASTRQPQAALVEFKSMVRALHGAGLEVVLDVVYNHTAEGGDDGTTRSLRGLDADAYYRIDWGDGGEPHFVDTTGCGAALNSGNPWSVGLVLDSLRYWATACRVDGFRFDLAPTLARPEGRFDPRAPILAACAQDPVLSGCKLICEPWDMAEPDGFALGRFEAPYREWNGRFRDGVRDFWLHGGAAGELAPLLSGSRDLFEDRELTSSINYATSHDGFTLRDLVSYERKHNEANLEDNQDGTDDNHSANCGVEGDTDDAVVLARRSSLVRALLATALFARGVPMVLGGDELGRTQGGNNNPYCQDNEVSWFDWSSADEGLRRDVAALVAARRRHARLLADPEASLDWWRPDGGKMTDDDWAQAATVSMRLRNDADALVVVVHRDDRPVEVTVVLEAPWVLEATTVAARAAGGTVELSGRGVLAVAGRPARA